jgi:hypothetical protein
MEITESDYLSLIDYRVLGGLGMNNGRLRELDPLSPVFKIAKVNEISYSLTSGYLTYENQFFPSPLRIYHCLLQNINCSLKKDIQTIREIQYEEYSTEIVLFNKNESDSARIPLIFKHFYTLASYINILNRAIEFGMRIKNLDIDKVDELPNLFEVSIIPKIVERLAFSFYENHAHRPGKDDWDWLEIEVRNLPSNSYLRSRIELALSAEMCPPKFEGKSIGISDNNLLLVQTTANTSMSFKYRKQVERPQLLGEILAELPARIAFGFDVFQYQLSSAFHTQPKSLKIGSGPSKLKDVDKLENNILLFLQSNHAQLFGGQAADFVVEEIHDIQGSSLTSRHKIILGVGVFRVRHSAVSILPYEIEFSVEYDTESRNVVSVHKFDRPNWEDGPQ